MTDMTAAVNGHPGRRERLESITIQLTKKNY